MQSPKFLVLAKSKHMVRSCVFKTCPSVLFLSASSFFNQRSAFKERSSSNEDNSKPCE